MNSSSRVRHGTDCGLSRLAISKAMSQPDLVSPILTLRCMALRTTPVLNTESFSAKVCPGSTISAIAEAVGVMKLSTTTLKSSFLTAS